MNLQEAYKILDIPQTSTPEEAKKQYRKLAAKLHPDVNKEEGAEDKFKKVNEAYQIVSSGKSTDKEEVSWQSVINNMGGFGFNPFAKQKQYNGSPIITNINLSFTESILGCQKEIK